jgi:hypothetical protein
MADSTKTFFVVAYNHDFETFLIDTEMTNMKFAHDTWDEVTGDWCDLDLNQHIGEDVSSLTDRLEEKLNDD